MGHWLAGHRRHPAVDVFGGHVDLVDAGFNDGVGIVVFAVLADLSAGAHAPDAGRVTGLFAQESAAGALLGLGWMRRRVGSCAALVGGRSPTGIPVAMICVVVVFSVAVQGMTMETPVKRPVPRSRPPA